MKVVPTWKKFEKRCIISYQNPARQTTVHKTEDAHKRRRNPSHCHVTSHTWRAAPYLVQHAYSILLTATTFGEMDRGINFKTYTYAIRPARFSVRYGQTDRRVCLFSPNTLQVFNIPIFMFILKGPQASFPRSSTAEVANDSAKLLHFQFL